MDVALLPVAMLEILESDGNIEGLLGIADKLKPSRPARGEVGSALRSS